MKLPENYQLHRGKAELRVLCDTEQAQHCKLANRKSDGNKKIKKYW